MSELALKLIAENKKTKNPKLDLGRCGLREMPKEILELTWLEELIFSNAWHIWVDSKYLSHNSQNLGEANKIETTCDLAPLRRLKKLFIGGKYFEEWSIQSLEFIKNNHHIELLHFEFNQVSDITPLQEFKKLTQLYFTSNQVSDISRLMELKGLSHIDFTSNQVSDISPIKELKGLSQLVFSNNQVSDISPIKELKSLSHIDFSYNQVLDITTLKYLTRFSRLDFSHNQVTDISPLKDLKSLTQLYFSDNQVCDLSPLNELKNLSQLDFSNNQVSDISPLKELKKLSQLDFSANLVSDISPLKELKSLTQLDFSDNQVSDISPLKEPKSLSQLKFSTNLVSDISPLKELTSLSKLYFSSNQVSDISPLKELKNLMKLDISKNQVSDLTILQTFLTDIYKLRRINYKNNPIEKPPLSILDKGGEAIQAYFNEQSSLDKRSKLDVQELKQTSKSKTSNNKKKPNTTLKKEPKNKIKSDPKSDKTQPIQTFEGRLLIIGNGRVGKSHLREHFINHGNLPDQIEPTHGIIEKKWKVEFPILRDGKEVEDVQINILDFGGQEYYHDSHHLFFNERTAFVILWSKKIAPIHNHTTPERWPFFYGQSSLISTRKRNWGGNLLAFSLKLFDFSADHFEDEQSHQLEYWLDAVAFFAFQRKKNSKSFRDLLSSSILTTTENLLEELHSAEYDFTLDVFRNDFFKKRRFEEGELKLIVTTEEAKEMLIDLIIEWGYHPNSLKEILGEMDQFVIPDQEFNISNLYEIIQNALFGMVHVIVAQNKAAADGIAAVNQEYLKMHFPFIDEFASISVKENYRMDFFKKEQIGAMLQKIPLASTQSELWDEITKDIVESKSYVVKRADIYQKHKTAAAKRKLEKQYSEEWSENYLTEMADAGKFIIKNIGEPEKDSDSNVHDLIVTRPKDMINRFYDILNRETMQDRNGRFTRKEAFDVVKSKNVVSDTLSNDEIDIMLELMKDFHIIFELKTGSNKEFIAPQYLPEEPIQSYDFLRGLMKHATYRIEYPWYVHRNIVQQFFSEYGNEVMKTDSSEAPQYAWWRNGIILKDNQNRIVLIDFSATKQSIDIFPQDGNPRCPFVKRIIESFKKINAGRNTIMKVSLDGQHYIPLSDLNHYAENNLIYFESEGRNHKLSDYSAFLSADKYPMKKVFLSYSSKDRDIILEMKDQLYTLESSGQINVWFDRQLEYGDLWDDKIMDKLKQSDIVIFAVSAPFLSSQYIKKEIEVALDLQSQRGEKDMRILPVILEDCLWARHEWIFDRVVNPDKAPVRSEHRSIQARNMVAVINAMFPDKNKAAELPDQNN